MDVDAIPGKVELPPSSPRSFATEVSNVLKNTPALGQPGASGTVALPKIQPGAKTKTAKASPSVASSSSAAAASSSAKDSSAGASFSSGGGASPPAPC